MPSIASDGDRPIWNDNPMEQLIPKVMFVAFGGGFFALGLYFLQNLDTTTAFLRRLGATIWGERIARFSYRREGLRFAAISFVILGPLVVVLGVVSIVSDLAVLAP
ncbi:hypothetical protein [Agromyces sp. NPDC055661]|jgi:hypothetical protein